MRWKWMAREGIAFTLQFLNNSKRTTNQEFTAHCSRNTNSSDNLQINCVFINNRNNETKCLIIIDRLSLSFFKNTKFSNWGYYFSNFRFLLSLALHIFFKFLIHLQHEQCYTIIYFLITEHPVNVYGKSFHCQSLFFLHFASTSKNTRHSS